MQNKVSVVIPAYNSAKTIVKVIAALARQSFKEPFEIIVVDDGSRDNTRNLVSQFKQVRYIFQENSGPASARNKGCYNAAGNIIFFLDADCIAHEDWIENAMHYFINQNTAVVAGSYGIANPESKLAYSIFMEIKFRHYEVSKSELKVFGSYNVAIRKDVFKKVGGFNEKYTKPSGEDNDLSYRIRLAGYSIVYAPDSLVDHFHPENFWKYMQEQFNHGFWRVKIYLKYPLMARGDGYTFWKDIVEPPFVLDVIFSLFFAWAGWMGFQMVFFPVCLLLVIEIFYGLRILKSFPVGMIFAFVMFCRAFVRTSGFLIGLLFFLPKILATTPE